jgi:hypothetical protein
MPRAPRLDVEGGVYHVMARGVERRAIFRDDTDRQNFLRQLDAVAEGDDLTVFAYVLTDGARTDSTPLIRELEKRYPGRSMIPPDGALTFIDASLEDYADVKTAA